MSDEKAPLEPPPSYDDAAQPAPSSNGTPSQPPRRLPLPLDLPALNMVRGKRVILASASPRRRQLLAQVRFPLVPPQKQPIPQHQLSIKNDNQPP